MTNMINKNKSKTFGRARSIGLGAAILALVFGPTLLRGQNPPAAPADLTLGQKAYSENCIGCHGADARGTDQGPPLIGDRRLRGRGGQRVRNIIKNGIPNSGMPPFDLPDAQLDALAAFVRSLNAQAADVNVPGDPAAGEQFFFGKGYCGTCHMVSGRGAPIGPDLSNLGHEMTLADIQSKLAKPETHIASGYELVTVHLQDGKSVRGFKRNQTNFDIRVEDLQGELHLFRQGQIASIKEEMGTVMPAVKATPDELQNLLAYLSRLTGVKPGVLAPAASHHEGDIDFARILHPKPGDWLTYNGKLNANRYSELNQINTTNVSQLDLKWIFTVPLWRALYPDTAYFVENMKYFGLETTPLVADGIMYITGPYRVYALDAQTGREVWEYVRPRSPGLVGDMSLGTNRGLAISGDKVFMCTDNAHMIALNRTTGSVVWDQNMVDEPQHYGSTVAPLVVKDLVIGGVAGADWGIRGFISAYKVDTGERVWRRWTIPDKNEIGIQTWIGPEPKEGGGSTWLTGSYDEETDTLFWTTATPFPGTNGSERMGDNLYTDCVLALDPGTGEIKWYYQFTPHDVHVWDATEPAVLVDTRYRGKDQKILILANRNGFFYVLDRTNGRVLLAKPFIKKLTWASGIGADGRPQLIEEGDESCPETAANWNSTVFSPKTRLYYFVAIEQCVAKLSSSDWKKKPPVEPPPKKFVRALNIETGQLVWEQAQVGTAEGKRDAGLLGTAGGLLFYGIPDGDFVAMDERNGKTLWHFVTNGDNKASPMTYMVGGKQYVAAAIGPNIVCFALPTAAPREKIPAKGGK
jgi:PQQ-dependent dehydrogenase (methanol/ethanol family)